MNNDQQITKFNLSTDDCIEILQNANRQYKLDEDFKRLPLEVQENAKKVLNDFLQVGI